MKWFIMCLIIIFIGGAVLISNLVSLTFIVVDDNLEDYHRANLIVIYDIKE